MIILGVPNKQLSANQFVNCDTMQKDNQMVIHHCVRLIIKTYTVFDYNI